MNRFPKSIQAVGIPVWKKPIIRGFFSESKIKFLGPKKCVSGPIVVWGAANEIISQLPQKGTYEVWHIEDGFLRSVGLGAALIKPLSLTIDSRACHFDSSHESDLEFMLNQGRATNEEIQRAKNFRTKLIDSGITKYNNGHKPWVRPFTNKKVILVVGQVESDASIQYGSPYIKTNLELLRSVRDLNHNAYIVYKPHPDVLAGLRASGSFQASKEYKSLFNVMIENVSLRDLLGNEGVDEVHVMTSLLGFEALIRGVKVFTYGQPFYSGWGLTSDLYPLTRRSFRLSPLTIDELILYSLIKYPIYFSWTKNRLISPEEALDELIQQQTFEPKLHFVALLFKLMVILGFKA